ncbi:hypothetical protein JRQ81_002964 [Phrynocephalus forsythii]|uniref:Uncharacterized protein n=1 Tax=Phrynocephalus forsythii TaxID=171643 RepID=A0A9Q1AWG8_9SAUR|nr:hypothetical protein JRQ81_002964 [Phrynocephalus forsythii]
MPPARSREDWAEWRERRRKKEEAKNERLREAREGEETRREFEESLRIGGAEKAGEKETLTVVEVEYRSIKGKKRILPPGWEWDPFFISVQQFMTTKQTKLLLRLFEDSRSNAVACERLDDTIQCNRILSQALKCQKWQPGLCQHFAAEGTSFHTLGETKALVKPPFNSPA